MNTDGKLPGIKKPEKNTASSTGRTSKQSWQKMPALRMSGQEKKEPVNDHRTPPDYIATFRFFKKVNEIRSF